MAALTRALPADAALWRARQPAEPESTGRPAKVVSIADFVQSNAKKQRG